MSYRDLRNFTETMRALGYPRLISMENFRTPNFALVAEILIWLVNRYDPTSGVPTDVDTEQDRVVFIKSVCQFLAMKASIKLNTKKLYGADGYAVKELLKVASLLHSAMRTNRVIKDVATPDVTSSFTELASKAGDLKTCRELASKITAKGAKLYELLGKELELREARKDALSRMLDFTEIEKGVRGSIAAVNNEIQRVNQMVENCAADEANLALKIEKKKQELERNQKRLRSLANVRPAFMDEYEKLEVELKKQYEAYMERFQNLGYLEHQLEDYTKIEQNRIEESGEALKRLQQQIHEAEKRMIHDDILGDDVLGTGHENISKMKSKYLNISAA